MFYRRQLSTYNYCIYDGASQVGTMILWNESVGHRGSDEVASCLLHYVDTTFNVLGPSCFLVGQMQRTNE